MHNFMPYIVIFMTEMMIEYLFEAGNDQKGRVRREIDLRCIRLLVVVH